MALERWVDLSKYQGDVPGASLQAMKADGITGICVGSWHGIDRNPYVESVLRRSRDIGLDIATYYVFNSRPGLETVERAVEACGSEWDKCIFHAPDVEIRGITERILRDGLDATVEAGGWPIIYTGNWFWNWWKLDLGYAPDFRGWPSWIAVYNGRPDLSVTPAWGLGLLRIHQYRGSTSAYDTTVDFNAASKAWMNIGRKRLEGDMDEAEVRRIVKKMLFRARAKDGAGYRATGNLERWFGAFDEHRKDKGQHSAGERHDHEFSGRTGEA